jgi:hypothetical protein
MSGVVMTATQVFGANPWVYPVITGPLGNQVTWTGEDNASGPAAKIAAAIVGGIVVPVDAFPAGAPFSSDIQINYIVLPNGVRLLAGLIVGMFDHGWTLDVVQTLLVNEVVNAAREELNLKIDPASVVVHMPTPPPAAPSITGTLPMVGGMFASLDGPAMQFGRGVVAGIRGTISTNQVDANGNPLPVNVSDGDAYTDPTIPNIPLRARVIYEALFRTYTGYWRIEQNPAAPAAS